MAYHTLRLILGDQLNASHSWFKQKQPGVLYLLAELDQEAVYTRHHIQKICAFFAAMEGFANAIEKAGLRDDIIIMVGGAPVTQEDADVSGADGYAADAATAVRRAKELLAVRTGA